MQQNPALAKTEDTSLVLCATRDNGVSEIILNRPGAYNALSSALMAELHNCLQALAQDPASRVIVISGSPASPGFCAGHDLKEMQSLQTADARHQLMRQCSDMMQSVVNLPKPVIAKVHGAATAAGCQLVASCDLAVAGRRARFGTSGVNLGLFCHTPMVALSRNVAPKHAMEMLLTGDIVDAETAQRIGLINRIVDEAALDAETLALATKIAGKSTYAIGLGKRAFYKQLPLPLDQAYQVASEAMVTNLAADDVEEGINAFYQGRPPKWRDR